MKMLFCFLSLSLLSATTLAQEKNWGGRDEMNGIRLKDFPKFEENWRLVTVRYRSDTNEQRFTFANPLAWRALMKGSKDYPDGSVFAKIGFITEPDGAFPSSGVPSGARRYQFMVRDKKKFKTTDGWGYALFQSNGLTYPEDPGIKTVSCHACHKIVPDRGYVFSEPMVLSPYMHTLQKSAKDAMNRLVYRDGNKNELPQAILEQLPKGISKVRLLVGDIQKNLFEGTLNEVRPALALESLKNGAPAILLSDDKKSFSAVFTNSESQECKESQAAKDMIAVYSTLTSDPRNPSQVIRGTATHKFCWK